MASCYIFYYGLPDTVYLTVLENAVFKYMSFVLNIPQTEIFQNKIKIESGLFIYALVSEVQKSLVVWASLCSYKNLRFSVFVWHLFAIQFQNAKLNTEEYYFPLDISNNEIGTLSNMFQDF